MPNCCRACRRQLVITADDLGYNMERGEGIVECHSKGAISRASLLVNAAQSEAGAAQANRAGLTMGLHFNMTEGKPVSSPESIPSLVKNGRFYSKNEIRNVLSDINESEIGIELQNQIDKFTRLTGRLPAYVDGHQHAHTMQKVVQVFARVLKQNGICSTRLPYEAQGPLYPWVHERHRIFLNQVISEAQQAKAVFDNHGIRYADGFVGLAFMGFDMTSKRLKKGILEAFTTIEADHQQATCTIELMTHPGYPCKSSDAGCGGGADDFSQSEGRRHELSVLTSEEMSDFYKEQNIALVCAI